MKPAGEDSTTLRDRQGPNEEDLKDGGIEDSDAREEPQSPNEQYGEAREEPSEGCGLRRILASPIVIGLSMIGAIAGATVGIAGDPRASSFFIMTMLFAYTLLSINGLPYRLAPLAAMIAAHIASITSYYSNPLLLPLIVVERAGDRYSVNLDVVQLALVYELYQLVSTQPCKPEKTKTPNQETSIPAETGPTPGGEPR